MGHPTMQENDTAKLTPTEIRSNTYFYEEIHLFDSIITVL